MYRENDTDEDRENWGHDLLNLSELFVKQCRFLDQKLDIKVSVSLHVDVHNADQALTMLLHNKGPQD